MPTHEEDDRFWKDIDRLTPSEYARFRIVVWRFISDLKYGRDPRTSLRIRELQAFPGIYELTWDGNGRATFSFGKQVREGHVHIIWRRVGTHDIFKNP